MSVLIALKRTLIWLNRFRYRKGYGVHSPFAFNLITWVFYEKYPFYKYYELNRIRESLKTENRIDSGKYMNSPKVDELLFRLVNRMQPAIIVEIGTYSGLTTLYLSEACNNACCHTFDNIHECNALAGKLLEGRSNVNFHRGNMHQNVEEVLPDLFTVDFLYVGRIDDPDSSLELCLDKVTKHTLLVIKGINDTAFMKEWWKKIMEDERTGITFDLYDLGLVFFDKEKIKQHYIVNF